MTTTVSHMNVYIATTRRRRCDIECECLCACICSAKQICFVDIVNKHKCRVLIVPFLLACHMFIYYGTHTHTHTQILSKCLFGWQSAKDDPVPSTKLQLIFIKIHPSKVQNTHRQHKHARSSPYISLSSSSSSNTLCIPIVTRSIAAA